MKTAALEASPEEMQPPSNSSKYSNENVEIPSVTKLGEIIDDENLVYPVS